MQILESTAYNLPHIRRIEAKNIRGFEELKLTFSSGINLVVGGKAEGKTNLIMLLCEAYKHGFILASDVLVGRTELNARLLVEYAPFEHKYYRYRTPLCYGPLGMQSFTSFKKLIRELPKDHCLVTELDWLIFFSRRLVPCQEVWAALSKARCQVIATVFDGERLTLPTSGFTIHRLPRRRITGR